jgi:trans-2,3-dihydro-3-hydroxyanthranilate isomerase
MALYRYRVVDVFTETALEGNPLAVFPDASGIDDGTMQKIARELNLSETVFVVPVTRADCAARIRIFTSTMEMLFAGHPTVGASFVLLEEALVPKEPGHFLLEEKVGPVAVRIEPGHRPLIWLKTPPIQFGRTYDRAVCARAVGLDQAELLDIAPQLASAGNPNIFIAAKDKGAVDRAWLDLSGLRSIQPAGEGPVCVFVFAPTADGAYSRMFAPEHGVIEDPATGSATGPLAAFMLRNGLTPRDKQSRFISEQGTKMGRRSLLHVLIHGENGADGIEVGGYVTPLVEATMTLADG